MKTNNTIIELSDIILKYPNHKTPVLDKFSLTIDKGDYIFLLGPNGSGKSTLFKLLMSYIKQNSGTIYKKEDLKIAYISQDIQNSLFLDLTILENLILMNIPINPKETLEKYLSNFNLNLYKYLDQPIKFLSGGEKQALILAIKLYFLPDLLLLDEHTSAMDPEAEKVLMDLTNKKIIENSITTIICTHNPNFIAKYGKRIIAMNKGKLILDESIAKYKIEKYLKIIY